MEANSLLNNRYQILQSLGSGGMANVYKAQDRMLERLVAIKVLKPEFSTSPTVQVRFRQEAKSIANLSHPNIVTVHDFGFDQNQLFLVMEYVPGLNVKQMLRQKGIFSENEALPIMTQVCAGLGYAHRAGIIHCDVKPHNIIITPDNRVKVMDFGIARAIAGINPHEQSDVVWGSPLYFSPEQATGNAPLPASDVYSAGVVFYEMLTGRPPFIAKTAESLAKLHRDAKPVNPTQYNTNISSKLAEVLLKVLSKEPSNRYRTADQFGRVLSNIRPDAVQSEERTSPIALNTASPIGNARPKRDRVSRRRANNPDWVTIGLGLLAVIAIGGLVPLWLAIIFKWINIFYR